jgi:hypothetical protein
MTSTKRYVLLEADGDVTVHAWKELAGLLAGRFGPLKVFAVNRNDRAFVVMTDVATSKLLRADCGQVSVQNVQLKCVRTSGSIGKLKRLASGSAPA